MDSPGSSRTDKTKRYIGPFGEDVIRSSYCYTVNVVSICATSKSHTNNADAVEVKQFYLIQSQVLGKWTNPPAHHMHS